jgi:hypothetical protein
MDSDFGFSYRDIAEYERDLDQLKEFSNFIRFNPSFSTDDAGVGAQLFGQYGRRMQFEESEHGGDDMKVDVVVEALPIRDADGNDTLASWTLDTVSAMAGRHDAIQRFTCDICRAWEEPVLYPEVKQDPAVLVRRMVSAKTEASAVAAEIVGSYVE